jgi:hypothetical protein
MTTTIESRINDATSALDAALAEAEQRCQAIRWRLANFPANQAVPDLETEIESLMEGAGQVGMRHGELKMLTIVTQTDGDDDDGPILFDPDVVGLAKPDTILNEPEEHDETIQPEISEALVNGLAPAGTGSGETTYNVIEFFGDTEIVEALGGRGRYATFEEAKEAAIDYLEDVIDLCELTIEGLRDADTPEQYFGTDAATISEPEGNVRKICGDHYKPDPELQGKPLPWFLGKLVKLRFSVPGQPTNAELMWVAVTSVRGDELVGTLTNEPLYADQCCGDEIVFGRQDVLVVEEGGVAA